MKRKISIAMAGMTAVASVVPVFAAENSYTTNELGTLRADLLELITARFTEEKAADGKFVNGDLAGKRVYTVTFKWNGYGKESDAAVQKLEAKFTGFIKGFEIKTEEDIEMVISFLTNNPEISEYCTIEVYDEGHRIENNKYYAYGTTTYGKKGATKDQSIESVEDVYKHLVGHIPNIPMSEIASVEAVMEAEEGARFYIGGAWRNYPIIANLIEAKLKDAMHHRPHLSLRDAIAEVISFNTVTNELTINVNGNPVTLKDGDTVLDLKSGVGIDGKTYTNCSYQNAGKIKEFTVATRNLVDSKQNITVNTSTTYELSQLYDGLFLTDLGKEVFDWVVAGEDHGDINSFQDIENGFKYTFTPVNGNKKVTLAITTEDRDFANLAEFKQMIQEKEANYKLIGDNRYETAIEAAREYEAELKCRKGINTAFDGFVLINGDALVDGLSAAPYASLEEQPILLTEQDHLSESTKNYIKSYIKTNPSTKFTVTIVGGTSAVSTKVAGELADLGVNVVRLGGETRHETSLKVAEQIAIKQGAHHVKQAFIVGANGEADAMSISAVAASSNEDSRLKKHKEVSPIIVDGFDGMSERALSFLEYTDAHTRRGTDIDIIGGTSAVSKQTEDELRRLVDCDVERISGSDRQETNANVIKRYYDNSNNNTSHRAVARVYVAKDGYNNSKELIDALTIAPLAAKQDAPIVLAKNEVSSSQATALKLVGGIKTNISQVGGGVKESVITKIASFFGLVR